ncbi:MAG TPA: GAF domain-containing protein [Armatimonadaceae bacterium]|nr:GAF domain-containing protein [Armatimonadaceae bacterium]
MGLTAAKETGEAAFDPGLRANAADAAGGLPWSSVGGTAVLLPLTAALLKAVTPDEVVAASVDQGMAILGARAGLVALVAPDGQHLEIVRTRGFDEAVIGRWRRIPLGAPLPLCDVVRTAAPLLLASRADWEDRYPAMVREAAHELQASAALPLVARGRTFGALHLSFPTERTFGDSERTFLAELARHCAMALDRALLLEKTEQAQRQAEDARSEAETANRRLEFLARASGLLAESLDYQVTLDAIARLAVPDLCDWVTVDMVDPAEGSDEAALLRLAVAAHVDPEEVEALWELRRHSPIDMAQVGQPPVAAILTGEAVFLPEITPELVAASARDERQLRFIERLDLRSLVSVPLWTSTSSGAPQGAVTLAAMRASGRVFTRETVTLAQELARRAALAVDNALLYERAQREVAERAKAERQAERVAADLRLVTDAAPLLIAYVGTDLRYRFVNQGYVEWFGRPAGEVVGKTVPEVIGRAAWEASRPWAEAALGGERVTYEALLPYGEGRQPRHVHIDMVPDFGPAPDGIGPAAVRGYVAVVTEITERVERERRQMFLADLTEATRGLLDPDEVLWETAKAVAEFTGASRCTYADIEGGGGNDATITVQRDYTRGEHIRSAAGAWRLRDMGAEMAAGLRAGQVVQSADTRTDARTRSEEVRAAFAALQARAVLSAPVNKGGELVGVLILHQDEPRNWSREEADLLVTVAERTWLALENARLRRAEREAAVQHRRFLREMLFGLTEGHLRLLDDAAELPEELSYAVEPVPLSPPTLRLLRRHVHALGEELGFPEWRKQDLLTAVGEASMNAVRHGDGVRIGRVHGDRAAGTIQVWVRDEGSGIAEHLIHRAIERGWSTGGFGHGFHLMWKTCDRVYLLTGPTGTTVVLEQDRTPPAPPWLADGP